jgi:hypothetical protein
MIGSFKGVAIRIIHVGRRGKRGIQTATLRAALGQVSGTRNKEIGFLAKKPVEMRAPFGYITER